MARNRNQITLEKKLEILYQFRSGQVAADIARVHGLTVNTVRTICYRDASKIKKRGWAIKQSKRKKELGQNFPTSKKRNCSRDSDKERERIQMTTRLQSQNAPHKNYTNEVRKDVMTSGLKDFIKPSLRMSKTRNILRTLGKSQHRKDMPLNPTTIENKTGSFLRDRKSNALKPTKTYKDFHAKENLPNSKTKSVVEKTMQTVKKGRTIISTEQRLEIWRRFRSGETFSEIGSSLNLLPATVKRICYSDPERRQKYSQTTKLKKPRKLTQESSDVIKKEPCLSLLTENDNQTIISSQQETNSKNLRWDVETMVEVPLKNLEQLEVRNAGVANINAVTPQELYESNKRTNNSSSAFPLVHLEAGREAYLNLDKIILKEELEELEPMPEQCSVKDNATGMKENPTNGGMSATQESLEARDLEIVHVTEAVQLISKAVDILTANDPDKVRITKFIRSMADGIECYKHIYSKHKNISEGVLP